MKFIVTARLMAANAALCAFGSLEAKYDSQKSLIADIKSRAREVEAGLRANQVIEPFQLDFLQCLRSRLQDHLISQQPVAREWLDAFGEAYAASAALAA